MENLPNIFSDQGIIAILFTIAAAIASVLADRKSKANITINKPEDVLIERAFDHMEKNLEELRRREHEVRRDCAKLLDELEEYRQKYYRQIEITNTQHAQLTKLQLQSLFKDHKDD